MRPRRHDDGCCSSRRRRRRRKKKGNAAFSSFSSGVVFGRTRRKRRRRRRFESRAKSGCLSRKEKCLLWGRNEKEKNQIQEFKDSNMEYKTLNEKKGTPSRHKNLFFVHHRRCVCDIPLFFWGREITRARIYHAHVVKNTARISPTLSLRRTFICTSRPARYFRKNVHDDCDSASCGCGDERCARHLLLVLHLRCGICASSSHRRKFLSRGGAWTRGSKRRTRIRMNDAMRVARVHLGKRYRSRSERSFLRRLPNGADFSRCFSFVHFGWEETIDGTFAWEKIFGVEEGVHFFN